MGFFKRHWYTFFRFASIRKLFNVFLVILQMLFKSRMVRGFPVMLKIESANLCNLKCLGCRSGNPSELVSFPAGILSFETFKKVIDEMGPYLFNINLYLWGDPLMNKQVDQLIGYASSKNIGVTLSTNMHSLSKELAKRIVKSGLTRLIVGIDGMSQKSYGKVRIGGDFNKAMNNLKIFLKIKEGYGSKWPMVEWQYIYTRFNAHEIESAKLLAKQLNVDYFTLIPDWCSRFDNSPFKEVQRTKKSILPCFWLWLCASIQWDGTVFPCCHTAKRSDEISKFGNIEDNDFKSIYNNESFILARQGRKKKIRYRDIKIICQKCRTPPVFSE